jgi:hypothetical protein
MDQCRPPPANRQHEGNYSLHAGQRRTPKHTDLQTRFVPSAHNMSGGAVQASAAPRTDSGVGHHGRGTGV